VCKSCNALTKNCTTCSGLGGICNSCSSPYTLTSASKCACPAGMDEIGNTCITLTPCADLKYNDGNGTCLDCGTNCTKCANVNGKCLNCTTDNAVDFANPKNCNYSSCVYPIGPVGQPPVTCLSTRFSTTRLIPPFSTDAVEVDWRTWGIVQDM